jgi:cell division protein FtsB
MRKNKRISKRDNGLEFVLTLITKHIGFILFLVALLLMVTLNHQVAERKVRKIQKLEKEVQELKWSYMNLKSDVMYNSTYSQVSRSVKDFEIENRVAAPIRVKSLD